MDSVPTPLFDIDNFWRFCADLRVDTKDHGEVTLNKERLLGSQRYFIEEIARGFAEGQHSFIVLKGRQLGITTICLALDLYWAFKHSGMAGSLVTHDEETRDMFKTTLEMYIDGLPNKWKVPIERHNRNELVAKNRSRLAYQVAGTRKNSKLGKGKGLTFMHSTETSEYGDAEGLASLRASLAQNNPNRLFIYETTAQGFNFFEEMWQRASSSIAERAIFIGWWRKAEYAYAEGPGIPGRYFDVYWASSPRYTAAERKWVRDVKVQYDFDITNEQMAWWRATMEEEVGDIDLMYQNYPPTAEYAFISSGSNFFSTGRLTEERKRCKAEKPAYFRFKLRENFEDTDLEELTTSKMSNMQVWQFPQQGAKYVIGADPAWGSSDWADRYCASVWRCYGDGMEQVAEFNTETCNTYQFAWVILYLAGAYTTYQESSVGRGQQSSVMLNLEINGPGQAVWNEMQTMRRNAAMAPKSAVAQKIMMVVQNMHNYLYKRVDSLGRPGVYHWTTTNQTKERMLNLFKDQFERGHSVVRSEALIAEMGDVIRDDGQLGARGRRKDDRVIAACLGHVAWADFVRMQCIQSNLLRPVFNAETGEVVQQPREELSPRVVGYLSRLGIKAKAG